MESPPDKIPHFVGRPVPAGILPLHGVAPPAAQTRQQTRQKTCIMSARQQPPEYLAPHEIGALLRAARTPKERLAMLIMWRAGIRVSEMLGLRPMDMDAAGKTLRIRQAKGGRQRIVPLHPELQMAMETASDYGHRRRDEVLVDVNRQTVWDWIQAAYRHAVELGAMDSGRRIGPHTLRHSAARHWLSNGVPINTVSIWLGHAQISTTMRYLALVPDPTDSMAGIP